MLKESRECSRVVIGPSLTLFFLATLRLVVSCFCLFAQELPTVSKDPGLYCQSSPEIAPVRLEGQVVSFQRSGSRLVSAVTAGIKSTKVNVQILGKTATLRTDDEPVFYYREPLAGDAYGGSAADLVLVRLQVRRKRRQFEMSASGNWRASTGISLRWQVQIERREISLGLYRVAPVHSLKKGQYAFYLYRGQQLPGLLYDFEVLD